MRALGLLATILAIACTSGCAAALRVPVQPPPAGWPTEVPWRLNRELLTPTTDEIVFVVVRVSGHAPEPRALDALVALAARYGQRPARWVMAGAPDAPPLFRQGSEISIDGWPDPRLTYVLVRYKRVGAFGISRTRTWAGDRLRYTLDINQERHRPFNKFLPQWRLEQQTLVHEYGHLLGLPSPDHAHYREGAHCVNPDCALVRPALRSVLYGLAHTLIGRHFLEDYCAACRHAVDEARRFWRALPTPEAWWPQRVS